MRAFKRRTKIQPMSPCVDRIPVKNEHAMVVQLVDSLAAYFLLLLSFPATVENKKDKSYCLKNQRADMLASCFFGLRFSCVFYQQLSTNDFAKDKKCFVNFHMFQ